MSIFVKLLPMWLRLANGPLDHLCGGHVPIGGVAVSKTGDAGTVTAALAKQNGSGLTFLPIVLRSTIRSSVRRTGQSTSKDFAKPASDEAKR